MGVEVTTLELNARLTNAEQTIAGLQRIGQAGGQAEQSFGSLGKQILGFGSMAGVAVIAGQKVVSTLVDMGKQSIMLAAEFEKSRMTWGVLVGDMAKGSQVFDQLFSFAAKTPLSFQGVNQAATQLKGFGVATNDILPALQKLGDLAMGDNGKLNQLAFVYGQTAAQGKALTRDLYQFINAGVPIFDLLATSMGKSHDEIQKLASTGGVTFDAINKAINIATSSGGQFYDMMNKTADTTAGKWSTAMDNFKLAIADTGKELNTMLTPALDAFNKSIETFLSRAKEIDSARAAWGENSGVVQTPMESMAIAQIKIKDIQARINKGVPLEVENALNMEIEGWRVRIGILQEQQRTLGLSGHTGKTSTTPGINDSTPFVSAGYLPYGGAGNDPLLKNIIAYNSQKYGPEPNGYNFSPSRIPNPYQNRFDYMSGYGSPIVDAEAQHYRQTPNGGGYQGAYIPNEGILGQLDKLSGLKDGSDEVKNFDTALKSLGKSMEGIASSSLSTTFESMGKAFASGANGADSLAQSMSQLGQQLTGQYGALLTSTGLQILANPADGGVYNPVGWMMLAAGGLFSFGSGMWAASNSNTSGTSTGSSAADAAAYAALTAYYQQTEAFNQQARKSSALSGYASGTNYAMGGWAWVGERGPELMRVPTGSQIIPNHVARGYADGLNVPGGNQMIVNIAAPSGYEAVQSESVDSSGARSVAVAFRRIARGEIARASQSARRVAP